MIGLARRRMMMGGNPLPYDARVDYLQSTGTQYIRTGINANTKYKIITTITMVSTGEAIMYSGCGTWQGFLQTGTANSLRVVNGNDYNEYNNSFINGRKYKLQIYRNTFTVNDTTNYTIAWRDNISGMEMRLFGRYYYTGQITPGKAIIHDFAVVNENGEYLIDCYAVRKDGVGYMYDKVSGQLLGNQGTGQFIIGPDI